MAGKVVTGLLAVAVIAGGVSWWQMDPSTRSSIVGGTGRIIAWFGIVLLWPWASFFLIGWVARFESNLAGGALVVLYTLLQVALLLWLFQWKITSPTGYTFVGVGGLIAAAYNLLTCDWIAEKLE